MGDTFVDERISFFRGLLMFTDEMLLSLVETYTFWFLSNKFVAAFDGLFKYFFPFTPKRFLWQRLDLDVHFLVSWRVMWAIMKELNISGTIWMLHQTSSWRSRRFVLPLWSTDLSWDNLLDFSFDSALTCVIGGILHSKVGVSPRSRSLSDVLLHHFFGGSSLLLSESSFLFFLLHVLRLLWIDRFHIELEWVLRWLFDHNFFLLRLALHLLLGLALPDFALNLLDHIILLFRRSWSQNHPVIFFLIDGCFLSFLYVLMSDFILDLLWLWLRLALSSSLVNLSLSIRFWLILILFYCVLSLLLLVRSQIVGSSVILESTWRVDAFNEIVRTLELRNWCGQNLRVLD